MFSFDGKMWLALNTFMHLNECPCEVFSLVSVCSCSKFYWAISFLNKTKCNDSSPSCTIVLPLILAMAEYISAKYDSKNTSLWILVVVIVIGYVYTSLGKNIAIVLSLYT